MQSKRPLHSKVDGDYTTKAIIGGNGVNHPATPGIAEVYEVVIKEFLDDLAAAYKVDLSGTITWNPASLIDGAGETSSAITVTGAAFGDYVTVAAPYDLQGMTCNGYVSAANTVKIRIQNETGGTIDLASGLWKVKVIKA